jgi:hypothetical protein
LIKDINKKYKINKRIMKINKKYILPPGLEQPPTLAGSQGPSCYTSAVLPS